MIGYFGGPVGTADDSDARGLQFNSSYFSKIGPSTAIFTHHDGLVNTVNIKITCPTTGIELKN